MNRNVYERFSIDDWIKLVNINKAIVSELQLDKVLILILRNALSSINAENGSLMLIDPEDSGYLKIVASVGVPDHIIETTRIAPGEGISGKVVVTGEPILIKDIEESSEFHKMNTDRYKTNSCISVPLKFQKTVIGVFNVNNKRGSEDFDEKDLVFAVTLASQAAIAIQNAQLFMQVRQDKKKLEDLNEELEDSFSALSDYTEELYSFHEFTKKIFESVITYMDIDQLTEEICKLFFKIEPLRPDLTVLIMPRLKIRRIMGSSGKEETPRPESQKLIDDISAYSMERQESIRIPFEEDTFAEFEKRSAAEYKSLLCLPLFGKEGAIGSLILLRYTKNKDVFDEKSRNLMSIFSLQVSTALSLVIALNEIMEKKVYENELKVAARIQRMFMPRVSPLVPGYELAHINIPTFAVGGDYIDFLWHDDDNLGIAVGDVSGKGVPAALIMALTKSAVKASVSRFKAPKDLLERINYELISEIEGHRFVTMIYGLYEWETRKMIMGKAGHNPPLLLKKDGTLHELHAQGLFLGMFRDCIIKETECVVEEGDILVFFTDGVIDAENGKGEQFGADRFKEFLKDNSDGNCDEILGRIIDTVNSFSEGINQKDDISLVVTKGVDMFSRELILTSRKSEITRLYLYFMKLLGMMGIDDEEIRFKVRLVIDEGLSNCIEHGNCLDETRHIRVFHHVTDKYMDLTISDEGQGFDWKTRINSDIDLDISSNRGRGIIILKELCDEVRYNEKGNELIVRIVFSGKGDV
ncbi:MAG: SpoIIE family protein phosphatase [Candidatus Muiribacteriaceae bacterium]